MPATVTDPATGRHLERLDDLHPRMAKVVKKLETPWREQVGRAMQRCFSLAGLSQKEGAALLDRDPAQVARWISGAERPQLDAFFAVESLRQPLIVALAELAQSDVTIETVIKIRRLA